MKEVVVTGPSSPSLASLDDLSDKEAFVRASSAYSGSLRRLNADFAARGLKPIAIRPIDEDLEDDDVLQMVSAGLLPYAIVDDYQAKVWAKILPGLRVRNDLVIHDDGAIAWAVRKNSPLLQKELAAFIAAHGPNTSFGATVMRRYFTGPEALRNADSPVAMQRFHELLRVFERSGAKYGFDDLMLMAQGYQDSQLDQSARSPRGAVGVMQVLPSTAAAPPLNIRGVDRDVQANVDAGAAYLRLVRDRYVNDPTLKDPDRTLMTFAAYNAGPGNFWRIRDAAVARGLDPHVWFNSVEAEAAETRRTRNRPICREHLQVLHFIQTGRGTPRGEEGEPTCDSPREPALECWTKAAPGRVSMSLNRALGGSNWLAGVAWRAQRVQSTAEQRGCSTLSPNCNAPRPRTATTA